MTTAEQAARDWLIIADNLRTMMMQTVLGLQAAVDASDADDFVRADALDKLAHAAWHIGSLDMLARTFETRIGRESRGY